MKDQIYKLPEAIIEEEIRPLRNITDILTKNITRSLQLLHESIKLEKQVEDQNEFLEYMYDVARATIVLMHASFETALRAIVAIKLKAGGDLTNVPFPGRKEKLTLNELTKYNDRSVNDLIDNAIDAYLSNLSFNSTNDLADTLTKLKISQEPFKKYYVSLRQMMERRHQIVHEADLKRRQNKFELEKINIDEIKIWLDTVASFVTDVAQHIADNVYKPKALKRLRECGVDVEDITITIRVGPA